MNTYNRVFGLISNKFLLIVSAFIMLTVGSSCLKKANLGKGKLMIVNAAPGFGPADVYIDGDKFNASPLAYPSNTTYGDVTESTRLIQVTLSSNPTPLFNGNLNVIENINQSLFIYNTPDSIQGFAVSDNFGIPASGTALIRLFQLSPGAPLLDFGILNGSTFTPLYSSRAFETNLTAITNSSFNSLAGGTYTFNVRVNGSSVSLYTSNPIVIQPGAVYTFYIKGISGNGTTPLGLEVITND